MEENTSPTKIIEAEDNVTPFLVTTNNEKGIDYNKLVDKFGCSPIDRTQLE